LEEALSLPAEENEYSQEESEVLLGNKLWRMQNFYWIKSKARGLIKLRFNRVQWEIVRRIEQQMTQSGRIRHYDLKARQQGISTFWLVWHLDDTCFTENTTTGLLAHRADSLQYLMEIVRLAHHKMPSSVRPRLGDDSKLTLSFPDTQSKFMGALQIRSTALHNLHVSELCFVEDSELRATLGACSERTNISMESTGNGVGNDGYQVYQDAKSGASEDGMEAEFFPWFVQEEYLIPLNGMNAPRPTPEEQTLAAMMSKDWGLTLEPEQILWRRATKRRLKGMFKQEFPETDEDAFLTSGHHFFDIKKMHRLLRETRQAYEDGQFVEETDDYTMFEKPIQGDVYVAGADPADGGNNSVLKIINVSKRREAFVFRARVSVPTFYQVCDEWGRKYNRALLGVERNNHGHAVLLGLDEICHYPNLYEEEDIRTHSVKVGKQMLSSNKEPRLGWETNNVSRPIMLDGLKYALEGDEDDDVEHFRTAITILDVALLKECLTFEEVDGKFQALEGEMDDDIFASSIAFQMYLKKVKTVMAKSGGTYSGIISFGNRESQTGAD